MGAPENVDLFSAVSEQKTTENTKNDCNDLHSNQARMSHSLFLFYAPWEASANPCGINVHERSEVFPIFVQDDAKIEGLLNRFKIIWASVDAAVLTKFE